MAIYFVFSGKPEIADKMHEALRGSPAYINSEIALVKDTDCTRLYVGNDNNDNIRIEVDTNALKIEDIEK
jgi:hypothetical protein